MIALVLPLHFQRVWYPRKHIMSVTPGRSLFVGFFRVGGLEDDDRPPGRKSFLCQCLLFHIIPITISESSRMVTSWRQRISHFSRPIATLQVPVCQCALGSWAREDRFVCGV